MWTVKEDGGDGGVVKVSRQAWAVYGVVVFARYRPSLHLVMG
jgi:hypothetical protein